MSEWMLECRLHVSVYSECVSMHFSVKCLQRMHFLFSARQVSLGEYMCVLRDSVGGLLSQCSLASNSTKQTFGDAHFEVANVSECRGKEHQRV